MFFICNANFSGVFFFAKFNECNPLKPFAQQVTVHWPLPSFSIGSSTLPCWVVVAEAPGPSLISSLELCQGQVGPFFRHHLSIPWANKAYYKDTAIYQDAMWEHTVGVTVLTDFGRRKWLMICQCDPIVLGMIKNRRSSELPLQSSYMQSPFVSN